MSDQAERYVQAVVDAVISGDAGKLESALRWLSKTDANRYAVIGKQLLDTDREKKLSSMLVPPLINTLPPFYYRAGFVYAAAYVDCESFMKEAFPAGIGIPYPAVKAVVAKVRAEFDQALVKRIKEFRGHIKDLVEQACGHSSDNIGAIGLARIDLMKGQALLIAAVSNLE